MSPLLKPIRVLVAISLLPALSHSPGQQSTELPSTMTHNPLLTESTLPFQFPAFDKIRNEHFGPAFEAGMAAQLKEIDAITANQQPPTVENTIVELERSGELLSRVSAIFNNLTACNTNPELQKLQRDLSPKLAAHSDAIRLNSALFTRIESLYAAREKLALDPESDRLLWRYYRDFVRAGARLPEKEKEQLKSLNEEIATLQTTFTQNTLKEVSASSVLVDSADELAGLTETEREAAAALAVSDGKNGSFAIRLQNTTGQPPLAHLTNRATREKVMAASLARGSRGGDFDNRAVVASLAQKRAIRATLLGFRSHADFSIDDQTASSVEVVNKLLAQLGPPALANARREAAEMQSIIDSEKGGFQLGAADWQFYAEKVRRARYDFDSTQLKPYFELNHVLLDGVFYAAGKLYGLAFKERHDLPVYEPTVRVFDVFNADGSQLAIFIADFYARANKNGGAWMNAYVSQNGLRGTHPVISNHQNIPKPPEGEPTLLTYDEVRTAFHEFGHALHGMFSQVKYPRFAGTSVPRDFVEFPSLVNEMWAFWPEVVENYAKHYKTGEPIPAALLEKMDATQKFNQGFATTELVEANIMDQAWHQLAPAEVPAAAGVVDFEAAALKKAGFDFPPVPPRYRSSYFSHIFSSGYSAGYYSYFWSEVLDAHTVEWFKTHGGLNRANGDRFRSLVLSRGGSVDAMKLYRDFTGSDAEIGPFLHRRGLDQTP